MKDYWSNFEDIEVILYPRDEIQPLSIPEEEKEFLSHTGFPDSAAPFLSFEIKEGKLNTASEEWGLGKEFEKYRVIGHNGSGDAIAIDQSSGKIYYFNHDNKFERILINSMPSKLAKCLRSFNTLIEETIKENGDDAFLDNNIPAKIQEWFRKEVESIDPSALSSGSFWSEQIESMAEGSWD